jgi:hypothetical protein
MTLAIPLQHCGVPGEPRVFAGPCNRVSFLAYKVASPVLTRLLRLLGSHHSLEQTVLSLARNRADGRTDP